MLWDLLHCRMTNIVSHVTCYALEPAAIVTPTLQTARHLQNGLHLKLRVVEIGNSHRILRIDLGYRYLQGTFEGIISQHHFFFKVGPGCHTLNRLTVTPKFLQIDTTKVFSNIFHTENKTRYTSKRFCISSSSRVTADSFRYHWCLCPSAPQSAEFQGCSDLETPVLSFLFNNHF